MNWIILVLHMALQYIRSGVLIFQLAEYCFFESLRSARCATCKRCIVYLEYRLRHCEKGLGMPDLKSARNDVIAEEHNRAIVEPAELRLSNPDSNSWSLIC